MRVVKEANERRNEILDAAERLFGTKGFDNTSTNDILNEVGIARGTLYYHFKSKEDILDAMIGRITEQLIAKAKVIAGNRELPVLKRLTMTILALNVDTALGHEVMEQVHRAQNALLHQKMQECLLSGVNPLITGLIEEGIEQGICRTEYPAEVVEMVMLYSSTAFDALVERSKEERERKITAFIYNLERLLGMKPGSLQETIVPIFHSVDRQEARKQESADGKSEK
ncbi:MAG: TetR/AcrR family transcriptional regulator [Clostridiaceae bacterium]|nr:TetR/AcrR family transcriptional regulator [Clostridiaceae bacterium]MDD6072792.1 TetR/AcrR family transcriptional regulator [Clostridium sp.]